MSIASPTVDPATGETPISRVDQVINERIREAAAALWRADLVRAFLQLFTWVVSGIVVWAIVDQWIYSPGQLLRTVALVAVAVGVLAYVLLRIVPFFRTEISPEYAASALERDLPELRQGLLSYITLRGGESGIADVGGLQHGIVRSLGAQAAGRLKSFDQLPSEATGTMKWWLAAIASVVCLLGYGLLSPKDTVQSMKRLVTPLASIEAPRRVSIDDVTPGDTVILAGQTLDISARIQGLGSEELPVVVWRSATASASKPERAEMKYDKTTRRYQGSIQLDYTSIGEMQYELFAGDATAGPFKLAIEDVPVIVGISVHYVPPVYTGEKPYTRTGGGITALSGSVVTVKATTNRPVSRAKIEFNPRTLGQSIQATAGSRAMQVNEAGTEITVSMPLKSVRGRAAAVQLEDYRIQVWDGAGQSSPNPIVYPIRVIEDLAPNVTIVVPQQSPKNIPIDSQQMIEVHAIDPDYGLKTIELELRRGIDVLANPVLWQDGVGATGNQVAEYRFRPIEHGLRVGDVVSVIAVASDNLRSDDDPSIEPNYSSTDAIEFKITMAEATASEPQGNDGLSKKNDPSPASNGEKRQTDEKGGGGGAGGESGAQSTAKGNTGGQSQAGNGSSQGEGTQEDQGQSGGGTSQSKSQEKSPEKMGQSDGQSEGTNDSNNNGESGSGESANGKSSGDSASGGSSKSDSQENLAPPGNGTDQNNSADPNASAKQNSGTEQSGKRQDGGNEQSNGSNQKGSGESDQGQSDQDTSGAENQSPSSSTGDSGDGGETNTNNEESRSPEHDGEAFERIREHLDQKQAQGKQSQKGSGQPEANPSRSGESGSSGTEQGKAKEDSPRDDQSKQSGSESGTGSESSEQSKGEQSKGEQSKGEQGKGDTGAGKQSSESESAESSDGTSSEGDQSGEAKPESGGESANQNSGKKNSGDGNTGNQKDGAGESGSESSDGSQPSNPSDANSKSNPKSKSGGSDSAGESSNAGAPPQSDTSTASKSGANSSKNGKAGEPSDSDQSQSSGEGGSGSGEGADAGSGTGAPQTPVDAPDLEYTKKATDMVLDYLKETRDAPDRELLEKLKWTEEDLRRFSERWQSLRESADTSPLGENREMKEALESLGMRPRGSASTNRRLEQDDLQGLRDSGARQAPPAALRDAFDAFRRAASRQKPQ